MGTAWSGKTTPGIIVHGKRVQVAIETNGKRGATPGYLRAYRQGLLLEVVGKFRQAYSCNGDARRLRDWAVIPKIDG